MSPPAIANSGTHDGFDDGQTMMSPGWTAPKSSWVSVTRAGPRTIPAEAPVPRISSAIGRGVARAVEPVRVRRAARLRGPTPCRPSAADGPSTSAANSARRLSTRSRTASAVAEERRHLVAVEEQDVGRRGDDPGLGEPAADAHRRTGAATTAPAGRSSSCGPRSAGRSGARARAASSNRARRSGSSARASARPRGQHVGLVGQALAPRLGVDRHRVLDALRRARSAGGSGSSIHDGKPRSSNIWPRWPCSARNARRASTNGSAPSTRRHARSRVTPGRRTAARPRPSRLASAARRSSPRSTSWSSWTVPPISPSASPGRRVGHDRFVQVGQVVQHLVRPADRVEVDRPTRGRSVARPRPTSRPGRPRRPSRPGVPRPSRRSRVSSGTARSPVGGGWSGSLRAGPRCSARRPRRARPRGRASASAK